MLGQLALFANHFSSIWKTWLACANATARENGSAQKIQGVFGSLGDIKWVCSSTKLQPVRRGSVEWCSSTRWARLCAVWQPSAPAAFLCQLSAGVRERARPVRSNAPQCIVVVQLTLFTNHLGSIWKTWFACANATARENDSAQKTHGVFGPPDDIRRDFPSTKFQDVRRGSVE